MVGSRNFRPKFRTKSRNFSVFESLMKPEVCPRNVLGHFFKTKICPKCFDETCPRSWCNQKQIPKWETTKITNRYKKTWLTE